MVVVYYYYYYYYYYCMYSAATYLCTNPCELIYTIPSQTSLNTKTV